MTPDARCGVSEESRIATDEVEAEEDDDDDNDDDDEDNAGGEEDDDECISATRGAGDDD